MTLQIKRPGLRNRQWRQVARQTCAQGRALYVNLELGDPEILHRGLRIHELRGLGDKARGNIDAWNLRGHIDGDVIPGLIRRLRKNQGRYSMVIIDPVYKLMTGMDENAAGDAMEIMNALEHIAMAADAAIVFSAHSTIWQRGR